ncbi:Rhamnogalacturonan acetylesterase RhgT [compost metagenome]
MKEIRAKKAHPILLTSIVRRQFEDGQLVDTHGQYPDRVRSVARTLGIPMIDMEKKTRKLLMEYGEESSKNLFLHVPPHHPNYPNGKIDDTHLNERGALVIAQLVVEGIKEQSITLAQKMK